MQIGDRALLLNGKYLIPDITNGSGGLLIDNKLIRLGEFKVGSPALLIGGKLFPVDFGSSPTPGPVVPIITYNYESPEFFDSPGCGYDAYYNESTGEWIPSGSWNDFAFSIRDHVITFKGQDNQSGSSIKIDEIEMSDMSIEGATMSAETPQPTNSWIGSWYLSNRLLSIQILCDTEIIDPDWITHKWCYAVDYTIVIQLPSEYNKYYGSSSN